MLKDESWRGIYSHHDVNKSFNSFLNSFSLYFESCFPMQHTTKKLKNSSWITWWIRMSCKENKKGLHILSRNSNCSVITKYYNQYCIVLRKIIRNANCGCCYNSLLMTAENKPKTTWSIINNESRKVKNKNHTPLIFRSGKTFFQTDFRSWGFQLLYF